MRSTHYDQINDALRHARDQIAFERLHSTAPASIEGLLHLLDRLLQRVCRFCPWNRAMSLENDRLTVKVETLREQLGQRGSP